MSSDNIPINVPITYIIRDRGDAANVIRDAQRLTEETGAMIRPTIIVKEETRALRTSVRMLAFDLRLVSSGLSILRREFEGLSPPMDAAIGGVRVLSAGFSAALGTWSFINRAQEKFGEDLLTIGRLTTFLKADFASLTVATQAASIVFAGLVGIHVGTFFGEMLSGIRDMKKEVRELTQDLQVLELQMLGLSDQSAMLREEQAMLNMIIAEVERKIEKQGFATAEDTARLESAKDQLAGLSVNQSQLAFQTARQTKEQTLLNNQMKRYEIIMGQIEEEAMGRLLPGFDPRGGFRPIPVGNQRANMVSGPIGSIQVAISLDGANIQTGADLETALGRGGALAGMNIRREMELDRYRVNSR